MAQEKNTAPTTPPARYLSRDLSWLKFNQRVLDQVEKPTRSILEQLRFLGISATNLDDFFMIRIGWLNNYLDYKRPWPNPLGLKAAPFVHQLLQEAQKAFQKQHKYLLRKLRPLAENCHLTITQDLTEVSQAANTLQSFFEKTLFPTLTPISWDGHSPLPTLRNGVLTLGVVAEATNVQAPHKQLFFVPIPPNLDRFYQLNQPQGPILIPIEAILQAHLPALFKNMHIHSTTLFRVTRNSNFSLEETEDIAVPLVEELRQKIRKRNQSRVVRLELAANPDPWVVNLLKHQWNLDEVSLFQVPAESLIDLSSLQELVQYSTATHHPPGPPLIDSVSHTTDLFAVLKQQDILLHHPYNSIDWLLNFLDKAAEDPQVIAIKITLYRLAPHSAIVASLLKAVAQGKHVVVLIEITARFDEEHNIQVGKKLEQAGCLVIYGTGHLKTHAKMMMIVRKEATQVTRYVHFSSGNYNEETARAYADISLMTTDEEYADDIAAFFNALTSHTQAPSYKHLITAPFSLREQLITMIQQEAQQAQQGLPAGIVIKVNALEDETIIEALYQASQAGVPIQLIVRGICCLIPQKAGLSTNITVRSIVGNFLEHTRLFYFHHQGDPQIYTGSADLMVRSFDKRIEALIRIKDPAVKQQVINILVYNLKDNVNSYLMDADGRYTPITPDGAPPFNLHEAFFKVTPTAVQKAQLFN